ncbi:MAG: DUF4097 family beta strand repeat protein [Clostridiales bacterium]|nr:DUF4097 family beta strand repeat protein [Clostridiales bacterium]
MSKVTKVVLIVGGAMVALGIVFSVLGFMVFRNTYRKDSSKAPEKNEVVISDSFTNIEVSEISDEVIIKPSEDGEVKVEYYDYDEIVHEVDVKGDTLTVEVKDIHGGEPWWTRIQFGFDLERIINNSDYDTQTVIYLPEDSYGSLKVNTVSGEIEVPEKYAFNDVAINTTSGSITCDCTVTGDIEIGTVSGEITFSSVNSNKFKASSTSGSVKLSNAKVSGAVTIDTVSGEIILNDVESGSLNTNSVSGEVTFTNLTSDDVNIDTTSGEVSGTITGDHEYDIDTVSGDISLPSDIKGEAMVNISTVSGDVEIEAA